MVYTDGIHLIADSIEELHAFAKTIGLNHCWFENNRKPHYDLMIGKINRAMMLNRAITNGAKLMSDRELIKVIQSKRRL